MRNRSDVSDHDLFVYGTLLPGLEPVSLRPLVRRLQFAGEARVRGLLLDHGAYPGLVPDPGVVVSTDLAAVEESVEAIWDRLRPAWRPASPSMAAIGPVVLGRLVCLPPASGLLGDLDVYEGYRPGASDSLFQRVLVEVSSPTGSPLRSAWAYICLRTPSELRVLHDGDYRAHRASRPPRS